MALSINIIEKSSKPFLKNMAKEIKKDEGFVKEAGKLFFVMSLEYDVINFTICNEADLNIKRNVHCSYVFNKPLHHFLNNPEQVVDLCLEDLTKFKDDLNNKAAANKIKNITKFNLYPVYESLLYTIHPAESVCNALKDLKGSVNLKRVDMPGLPNDWKSFIESYVGDGRKLNDFYSESSLYRKGFLNQIKNPKSEKDVLEISAKVLELLVEKRGFDFEKSNAEDLKNYFSKIQEKTDHKFTASFIENAFICSLSYRENYKREYFETLEGLIGKENIKSKKMIEIDKYINMGSGDNFILENLSEGFDTIIINKELLKKSLVFNYVSGFNEASEKDLDKDVSFIFGLLTNPKISNLSNVKEISIKPIGNVYVAVAKCSKKYFEDVQASKKNINSLVVDFIKAIADVSKENKFLICDLESLFIYKRGATALHNAETVHKRAESLNNHLLTIKTKYAVVNGISKVQSKENVMQDDDIEKASFGVFKL